MRGRGSEIGRVLTIMSIKLGQVQIKKSMEGFQQMIQERLMKVEEIQKCVKLSAVSLT